MHKKLRPFAALSAGMLLLTGCVFTRDTDLSKRYPDYFRYTFGSDYSFKLSERVKGDYPYDVYYLGYGDKHEPVLPQTRVEITPYKDSMASADHTEEEYYLSYLELLIEEEASDIFRLGFSGVIKEHFAGLSLAQSDDSNILTFGDGYQDGTIYISVLPLFNVDSDDERDREQAKTLYQPDTGIKICAQSMQSLAQNDQFAVTVLVRLAEDVSPAQYTDKFEALVEAYLSLEPQNYAFILKQKGGSGDDTAENRTLSAAYGILGEPIDYAAHAAAHGEGYMLINDMRESWLAKYQ